MMKWLRRNSEPVHDFPGGIRPPQHKSLSNGVPIRPGPLPRQLVLPLNMHAGAPARALVRAGQPVLRGEQVAAPGGPVSAAVHAPTSGRVIAVEPRPIQHPSGLDAPCIVIEPDGLDRATDFRPVADWMHLAPERLVEIIRACGIAGLGGAGFPTATKVTLGEDHDVKQLLINAVECEPYITADDLLMRERADEIIAGIRILQHVLKPAETLVGIEDNKAEAVTAMRTAAGDTDIRIRVVPTKYPSGGERQLIQLLTGKEVPSGRLPADAGVVCHNAGTARAIHRAVEHGEPLTSRITTLTGRAVARPGNYEVMLGTPVRELLAHGGTDPGTTSRLIMGGPMMGFAIHTAEVPLVKASNCIIAATAGEMPAPEPEQPCIRCGACEEACPAGLLPQQLYRFASAGEHEAARDHHLMDCIECGACAWVCPSNIPLVQYYRHAKDTLRQQDADREKADRARQRFEARKARLEREHQEKEARRRARLQASRSETAANGAATASASSATSAEAQRKKSIAALKSTWKSAHKQWKEAAEALERARRSGVEDTAALRQQVEKLEQKADDARRELDAARATEETPA